MLKYKESINMRKNLILFLVLAFSGLINAQMFVGGGLGLKTSNGNYTNYAEPQTTIKGKPSISFSIQPMMGYIINEDFTVGLKIGISHSSNDFSIDPNSNPLKRKETTFGISPFARYYFLKWNDLSVYMQTNLDVLSYSGKEIFTTSTTNLPSTLMIGVGLIPAIQYDINERFGLFTNLNFLHIGYSLSRTERIVETNKIVTKGHSFDFSGNTDELLNVDGLQIGFYIKI